MRSKETEHHRTSRRRAAFAATLGVAATFVALFAIYSIWNTGKPVYVIGDASDASGEAKAQAEIDEATRASSVTVNIADTFIIDDDGVFVGFVVDEANKNPQRLVIKQSGDVVYESDAIMPGEAIEVIEADMHDGACSASIIVIVNGEDGSSATMTVRVVDERK